MRNKILAVSAALGLGLMACLGAPAEPTSDSDSALRCGSGERVYNGACHASCATSTDCGSGSACTSVGQGVNLCLETTQCAYLASDVTCDPVSALNGSYGSGYGGDGYGNYGYGDPYGYGYSDPYGDNYGYGYGYGGYGAYGSYTAACVGNAHWTTVRANGDPSCGQSHSVNRCRRVAGACVLITATALDIADPG